MNDCLEVCTKLNGCTKENTHIICKLNSPDSYYRLNELFKQ